MLRAAVRRIGGALEDLTHARARRGRLEAQMTGLLDELGIDHARICQIPGLTAAGLAAILAGTGDLRRYSSSSSVVKHAGMSPARNESAAFHGKTKMSRRGGPRCGGRSGGPPGRCCGTATWPLPSTPP